MPLTAWPCFAFRLINSLGAGKKQGSLAQSFQGGGCRGVGTFWPPASAVVACRQLLRDVGLRTRRAVGRADLRECQFSYDAISLTARGPAPREIQTNSKVIICLTAA